MLLSFSILQKKQHRFGSVARFAGDVFAFGRSCRAKYLTIHVFRPLKIHTGTVLPVIFMAQTCSKVPLHDLACIELGRAPRLAVPVIWK